MYFDRRHYFNLFCKQKLNNMKRFSILIVLALFLVQGCQKKSIEDLTDTSLKRDLDPKVAIAEQQLVTFIHGQQLVKKMDSYNSRTAFLPLWVFLAAAPLQVLSPATVAQGWR